VSVDTVTLTLPRKPGYLPLLHLVLGGIALRKDLSFDDLDDVQLAVDSLLAEDTGTSGDIEVKVSLKEDGLLIRIGVLSDSVLRESLRGEGPASQPDRRHLDICMLLRGLCEDFTVVELDGDTYAVELWKKAG